MSFWLRHPAPAPVPTPGDILLGDIIIKRGGGGGLELGC